MALTGATSLSPRLSPGSKSKHQGAHSLTNLFHRRHNDVSGELIFHVFAVQNIGYHKSLSKMMQHHGLRCRFHLNAPGNTISVAGVTESSLNGVSNFQWSESSGNVVLHISRPPQYAVVMIEVLCGKHPLATTVIDLQDITKQVCHESFTWNCI